VTGPTNPADPPLAYSEERTTLAVTIAVAAISTGAGLLNATSSGHTEMVAGWILLIAGNASALATYLLLKSGRQQAAGLLIVLACGGITTALMILGLGLHDVAVMGFPLVVLISGLMLRRRAYALSLLVCVVGLATVAGLEARGLVSTPFSPMTSLIDLLSILMVLVAVAVFVRMLSGGFRQALGRALESERAVALSNRELEARAARLEAQERERARLISDLEAKNAELERFTYTVSHDLKSPLITVRAYLDSIAQDLDQGRHERIREDLRRVSTASDKMRELLDGLLRLSRVGRIVNPPEDIPLQALVEEGVAIASGRLAARGVATVVAPGLPVVRVDRQRVLDVLVNLLDNAAKFMGDEPEPRLYIDALTEDGQVTVRLRDNGIGIERGQQERIFGLFERLNPSSDGTGLGLALARRIVEAHGGRIWVESEGAGRGATFCFTLPAAPGQSPDAGPKAE
jgi:signal transduction histidine kinase